MMFLQVNQPEKGDPFFNNKSGGGISTAITADNAADGLNVMPNCVGGAVGAYNKAACSDLNKPEYRYLNYPPNAENIPARAQHDGLPVSMSPAVGALVVWQKGETLASSDGAGHVAFVHKVDPDGTIYTSESEWHGRVWVNRSYKPPYVYGTGYKMIGFVHLPAAPKNPYPAPTRTLSKRCSGSDVRWLQFALCGRGYLRTSEVDGDFGVITLGAVLAFQLENGLEVDGVCGEKTRAMLKEEY